ncbi:hypothetical protein ES332_A01G132600v1 [Gossypium tomentosum]|uniref:Uncharacterized protein n=1 Tax=Gossypium tomentosum TaxID=34277 RepID=A0A5D2RRF3_GOSTO|nr:hypothetical protein ES332_A01G132600v1 [Gossypium tomentosum]
MSWAIWACIRIIGYGFNWVKLMWVNLLVNGLGNWVCNMDIELLIIGFYFVFIIYYFGFGMGLGEMGLLQV